MLFRLPFSAFLLALVVLADASSHDQSARHAGMRRRQLNPRGVQTVNATISRSSLGRRSCKKPASSSSVLAVSSTLSSATTSTHTTTTTHDSVSTQSTATHATTTTTKKTTTAAKTTSTAAAKTTPASGSLATVAVAAPGFTPIKPFDWPSQTQSGPQPTSTVASPSDPYLEELSKAIDNSGNAFFTEVHTGDMTYYGQGLGACGDVYDDSSFTAAVSEQMFDNWPGASAEQNRNPICGPFVPGRQALNSAGVMAEAVTSSIPGYAVIGGDGLINCVGSSSVQCHVPMTATVTHAGKSIQVQIVDRCVGCAVGDIDLTPAAFAALADMSLGRTSVTWQFDAW